ncbi:MAG: hypothetical protein IT368_10600, partial [Candidatus Hydrogenedentes bacterium]|nr:hypothetical protein [Candidatus Hydrogenedentota bacterium]
MIAVLAIAWAAALGADNLLGNPGFEETVNQRPAAWDVYLQDAAVSLARVDGAAQSGAWSAMIQNALPYDQEPYNNWSQNVVQKLGGQRLRVAASVRTENVGGAALWVQCWQERPLRVLRIADTSEATPISGTHDWQALSLYFTPPPGTDFLTVRCV